MNPAFVITIERQKQLSTDQLLLEYQILEARKQFLVRFIHRKNAPLFRTKLRNCVLWICLIREELETRIEKALSTEFLTHIIRFGHYFTID